MILLEQGAAPLPPPPLVSGTPLTEQDMDTLRKGMAVVDIQVTLAPDPQ